MAERGRLRDAHIHDHFGTLFALLVASFVTSGFVDSLWARVLTGVLQLMMLSVAFFSTRMRESFPLLSVLAFAGALALFVTVGVEDSVEVAHGVAAFAVAFVYLGILVAVFRRVLAQRRVNSETILGALCVYFLVGLMFSSVFAGIDWFSVEPIFGHPVPRTDYSYFSFVTLTTVGYGDLTAVTAVARRVAVIEAMTGQVFLATAVARLVSLYGVDLRAERRSTGADRDRELDGEPDRDLAGHPDAGRHTAEAAEAGTSGESGESGGDQATESRPGPVRPA